MFGKICFWILAFVTPLNFLFGIVNIAEQDWGWAIFELVLAIWGGYYIYQTRHTQNLFD